MTRTYTDRRRSRIVDAPQQLRIVTGITAVPMSILLFAAIVLWLLSERLFDEAQASNAELPTLGTGKMDLRGLRQLALDRTAAG